MKYVFILLFLCLILHGKETVLDTSSYTQSEKMPSTLKINIGLYTFKAKLFDNETTTAFKAILPLNLFMSELNGNEKYFHFSNDVPIHSSNPRTIHSGDLMLWGTHSFVLFYQTFSTSYAYTRLGCIEDITNLVEAVSKGDVMVRIELE